MTLTVLMLIATPLLAFVGAGLGHGVRWRSATDLDRWRKREETMRMVRWAAELATADEPMRAVTGVVSLRALLDSPLLDAADDAMVATIAEVVTTHVLDEGVS